jgi:enterochelin esterase family protein
MPYTVFLPPGYDDGDERYPVLYMLHGMGGQRSEWREVGLLDAADALMGAGAVDRFVIVLPQARAPRNRPPGTTGRLSGSGFARG